MDLIKLISSIFGIKRGIQAANHTGNYSNTYENERTKAYSNLQDKKMEELRIPELEKAVYDSFMAVDLKLTYMENKVWNVAGHLSMLKECSKNKVVSLFEKGIQICDCSPVNPMKLVKAANYFYDNYYSPEKQAEYCEYIQNVNEKYEALQKELNKKYKQ